MTFPRSGPGEGLHLEPDRAVRQVPADPRHVRLHFSTCGSCSSYESNPRARRTFAVDAATGRLVWRFPDGEYSPVIADRKRLYLTGLTSVYGLAPRG